MMKAGTWKRKVEHVWGFSRAEEVLEIVDYLAGIGTIEPNQVV